MNKELRLFLLSTLLIALLVGMVIVSYLGLVILNPILGAFFGIVFNKTYKAAEDVTDISNWQVSLRKLLRGDFIKKDSCVRVSFAYLFRIKIGNKYLLIKNSRGTEKFQPVGGVYKYFKDEQLVLSNSFHIADDDKIPMDSKSQYDYRLQIPCKYLKRFVKRFDSKEASRERINNLSREFKEELGFLLNWDKIQYRYCGRHFTEVEYSKHFKCYQLQLADIVELVPTDSQISDLENLISAKNKTIMFATASDIEGLGIVTGTNKLKEIIADHSINILQENEQYLLKTKDTGEVYEVDLT